VPFDFGTAGHSDGDVLLHAVVNALLGALGAGDIGEHFPDSDPQWAGADSRVFLDAVIERVRTGGFEIANLDVTVLAEAPRLAPYRNAIRERVAELALVESERVNVKFGTGERVGVVGRSEAIEAHAVVLLER
jgi:2-C-methyl-D-erythritol 2,4-cyclodiphosphate synthase